MEKIESISYCLHCGNKAPQKLVFLKEFISDYAEDNNGEEIPILFGVDYILECQTCSRLSVYVTDVSEQGEAEKSFYQSKRMWPTNTLDLDSFGIPKDILDTYAEASKIKFIAPNAFAVLMRRALEVICIDQGISEKKSLHESLKKLTVLGKLPPLLSEVSNIIKIIGNAGAHAVGAPIYRTHVLAIDDFFRLVLEYLYVAPNKLEKFKKELEEFRLLKKDTKDLEK
jgi:hypothetical protein